MDSVRARCQGAADNEAPCNAGACRLGVCFYGHCVSKAVLLRDGTTCETTEVSKGQCSRGDCVALKSTPAGTCDSTNDGVRCFPSGCTVGACFLGRCVAVQPTADGASCGENGRCLAAVCVSAEVIATSGASTLTTPSAGEAHSAPGLTAMCRDCLGCFHGQPGDVERCAQCNPYRFFCLGLADETTTYPSTQDGVATPPGASTTNPCVLCPKSVPRCPPGCTRCMVTEQTCGRCAAAVCTGTALPSTTAPRHQPLHPSARPGESTPAGPAGRLYPAALLQAGRYVFVIEASGISSANPRRFETAFEREARLFALRSSPTSADDDELLRQCLSRCAGEPRCKGVFFQHLRLCYGLKALGAMGDSSRLVPTASDSVSLRKQQLPLAKNSSSATPQTRTTATETASPTTVPSTHPASPDLPTPWLLLAFTKVFQSAPGHETSRRFSTAFDVNKRIFSHVGLALDECLGVSAGALRSCFPPFFHMTNPSSPFL